MNFICAWPSWFCLPLDILIIIPLADTKVKRFSRKSLLWRQACYKKLYFIVFCFLNGLCFMVWLSFLWNQIDKFLTWKFGQTMKKHARIIGTFQRGPMEFSFCVMLKYFSRNHIKKSYPASTCILTTKER